MRKNKLYTANKWNKRLFLPGGVLDSSGQNNEVVSSPYAQQQNTGSTVITAQSQTTTVPNTQGIRYDGTTGNVLTPYANSDEVSVGKPSSDVYTPLSEDLSTWERDIEKGASTGQNLASFANSILKNTPTSTAKALPATTGTAAMTGINTALSKGLVQGIGLGSQTAANTSPLVANTVSNIASNAASTGVNLGKSAANIGTSLGNSMAQMSSSLPETVITTGGNVGASAASKAVPILSNVAQAAAGAGIGVAGQLGKWGLEKLGSGQKTPVGEAISTIGNTAGAVVSLIPGIGWFVGPTIAAASNIVGGVVNAGWGHKTYNVDKAKNWLNNMSGFKVNGSNDNVEALSSRSSNAPIVTYKDGWFTDKGEDEANMWNSLTNDMKNFNDRSVSAATANNIRRQMNESLRNYSAYGGPIGGAVDYGFMSDYLTLKERQGQQKNKITSMPNSFTGISTFASGGDMDGLLQSHGSNWNGGVSHINAGGSHETNPNEGVQYGVDSQGVPNMVEEGEVVWNDFVFSDRIKVPQNIKRKFGVRGKREMSFADVAKKLQKESEERPNDPISLAGLDSALEQLADTQEELKRKMEEKSAQEEFAKLPYEQQLAIMQEVAAQEQQAQQQAIQEGQAQQQAQQMSPEEQQAMQEQAEAQQQMAQGQTQMSPEEAQLAQEQYLAQQQAIAQQQEAAQQAAIQQGAVAAPQMAVNAYGGLIHRYGDGGNFLNFIKQLGFKSIKQLQDAGFKPQDFFGNEVTSWSNIDDKTELPTEFVWNNDWNARLQNAAVKAALSKGWLPGKQLVQRKWYEGTQGNKTGWTASHGKDRLNADELNEYAQRYPTIQWALDNGILTAPTGNGTVSTKEIAEKMSEAPDWINTDKWLYDSNDNGRNMAEYLGMARGFNDEGDTKFENAWSKWGTFSRDSDGNYHYNLNNLSNEELQAFTDYFKKARTDGDIGVMYNSFKEPVAKTYNYAIDKDGNIITQLSDTTGYTQTGSPYTWGDDPTLTNNTVNFYLADKNGNPIKDNGLNGTGDAEAVTGNSDANGKKLAPVLKNEKLQYMGLMGPLAGLGLWASGVGKPDYSGLDAAVSASGVQPIMADYMPIGNYLAYKPLDTDYEINKLASSAAGSRRAILNSGSTPARMAGIVASDNQMMGKIGDLYRAADESNFKKKTDVATFNRDTDKFNAQSYNAAQMQYAQDYNKQKELNAQMQFNAAKEKMESDASWYGIPYQEIGQMATAIGKIGEQNANHNVIARMGAQGLLGHMNGDNWYDQLYVKNVNSTTGKSKKKG